MIVILVAQVACEHTSWNIFFWYVYAISLVSEIGRRKKEIRFTPTTRKWHIAIFQVEKEYQPDSLGQSTTTRNTELHNSAISHKTVACLSRSWYKSISALLVYSYLPSEVHRGTVRQLNILSGKISSSYTAAKTALLQPHDWNDVQTTRAFFSQNRTLQNYWQSQPNHFAVHSNVDFYWLKQKTREVIKLVRRWKATAYRTLLVFIVYSLWTKISNFFNEVWITLGFAVCTWSSSFPSSLSFWFQ